ncbi:hypothetical protein BVRB_020090, partial [Beta vulgaris subsp. vulgaris]
KNVAVTGCGAGSIGGDLVKAPLGAKVGYLDRSLTTLNHNSFLSVGRHHVSLPFTITPAKFTRIEAQQVRVSQYCSSVKVKQDVDALIDFIYDSSKKGLGVDLDYINPFASISENGRSLLNIDSRSELAHRTC